jgi:signal transduction histidine kinase
VDSDPPGTSFNDSTNRREVSSSDRVEISFNGRDKWDQTPVRRLLFSHRLDERPWSPYTADFSVTYTNLLAGSHRFEVRAMDRNWNEQPQPQVFDFVAVTPWYREPRVLALTLAGIVLTVGLAALALNRHFQLLRSYAEVGRIVEQRTRELERANQELLHSQKMRALGTLAAGIAHDFNNILSIIKGSAQIIESNTGDPDKVRTRLDRIKTVVDQGSSIVKAMLGFSRAGGRVTSECDLNQLVNQTTRLLGDQFLKEISIRLELADAVPKVECAGDLIQQMLLNLIINAADSMEGQGEVVLRTALLDEMPQGLVLTPPPAPRFVSVSVEDSGSGISAEVLPRIFEPFFTTKALSTQHGTGLGLSMVYEIARELGCGIRVASTPGKGSSFSIIVRAGAP